MEIYNPDSSFDFNSITLANPQPAQSGSFFTKLSVESNKPLYIQLPKCVTKQNIVEAMRGKYCDLMFERTDEDELMNWIEKFEIACQEKINSKKSLWFQSDLTRDDIESMMSPITRLYKSGKYILIRSYLNTNKHTGKDKCIAYDENEMPVELETINSDKQIIPLILIDGIKFSSRSFEIEIKLIQIMVIEPPVIKEVVPVCLIKNNKNTNLTNLTAPISIPTNLGISDEAKINENKDKVKDKDNVSSVIENASTSSQLSLSSTTQLSESSSLSVSSQLQNNTSQKSTMPLQSNTLQIDTIQNNIDINVPNTSDKSNLSNNSEVPLPEPLDNLNTSGFDGIQEVNLDFNEIKDTITLKKPNDVYYEIYKAAREKAKHMRKVAIEAYLEAKQIKTKYMLSDIEDSEDESDDDEENNL